MRYILEVVAIVDDPMGEPIRLGAARYYVQQAELTQSNWSLAGARAMTLNHPFKWWMPVTDGRPSGAISIECTLTEDDPDRKVPDA